MGEFRRRSGLLELIETTAANGIVLLSGNVHFAKISQVEIKEYPLLDFTSSGLTRINEVYAQAANNYRVTGPMSELNFGLVEIDWSARSSAQIMMKAINGGGSVGFAHRVSPGELQDGNSSDKNAIRGH